MNKVVCARIVGRSHKAGKIPCQDFVSVFKNKTIACIALADGAGSRSKSEIGAESVVNEILNILQKNFDYLYDLSSKSSIDLGNFIHKQLIAVLKNKTIVHSCKIDDLASTLLFVAYKNNRYFAGHIGDGVIAEVADTTIAKVLSKPSNGEYSNTTYFVTDPNAVIHFHFYSGETNNKKLSFVIMSDGCAESLYNKKSMMLSQAISKLTAWNMEVSRKKMQSILNENFKQNFSILSTDDCSLAIMSIS